MTRYTGRLLAANLVLLPFVTLSLLFSGCGNRHPGSQAPEVKAESAVKDAALYREIRGVEPDNSCICNSTKTVNYYLDNPSEFEACTSLHVFTHVTDCALFKRLISLRHLTVLSFGDYACEEIPEEILKARHLTSLSIDVPPSWKKIPSILFRIPNLTDLGFGGDSLSVFEDDIPVNSKLEDMDFYYSPIEEVPMIFAKFPKLMRLNIGTPEHPIRNVKAFRELRPDISLSSNEFD
jgi:hypothetical protein